MSRPRRRRDPSPRNIHVAAAASPRPVCGISARRKHDASRTNWPNDGVRTKTASADGLTSSADDVDEDRCGRRGVGARTRRGGASAQSLEKNLRVSGAGDEWFGDAPYLRRAPVSTERRGRGVVALVSTEYVRLSHRRRRCPSAEYPRRKCTCRTRAPLLIMRRSTSPRPRTTASFASGGP